MEGRHGTAGSVCAVIVAYQPDAGFPDFLAATLAQVDHAVIINNGTDDESRDLLNKLQSSHSASMTLIANPDNGLAKAQNLGIHHARERGDDWVLLLDDDSLPEPDMVKQLLGAYSRLPAAERAAIGLIAPDIVEDGMPPYRHALKGGMLGFKRQAFTKSAVQTTANIFRNAMYACASGSLIPTRLFFNEVGMMNEDYYMYYVDIEFCLRLQQKKFSIVIVREARLHHRIGERSQHQCLGKTISTTNHSPEARYYQFRNRILVWRTYGLAFPAFLLLDYLRMNYEMMRVMLLEKSPVSKLQSMLQGLTDGVRGQTGKHEFKG